MRKTSPEAWMSIVFIVALIVTPIVVGVIIYKTYRYFYPMREPEVKTLADIGSSSDNSFFKILIIGWSICGPLYYWLYQSGVFY